jgi:hypothetical protein
MGHDGKGTVDRILAGLDYVAGAYPAIVRHLLILTTHDIQTGTYVDAKDSSGPLHAVVCMSIKGPPSKALRYALFYMHKGT